MRILVIGGSGFLGTNLTLRVLRESVSKVTLVDPANPHAFVKDHTKISWVGSGIENRDLLNDLVRDVDIIFNCASQSSHLISIQNPLYDAQVNAIGHLNLLEAVRQSNPNAVVVYPSTTTVMGKQDGLVLDESYRETPLEIYSANKLASEKYSRVYHDVYGLKTILLRFPNLYGAFGKTEPEYGFINYFISLAQRNQSIEVFGSGEQIRNVMYVEDAVDILFKAALDARLFGRVYFATTPFHYSVADVAKEVVSVFGSGEVEFKPWPHLRNLIEVGSQKFSSHKLSAITGWHPQTNLRAGLEKTKAFFDTFVPAA